jgi:hypothetical protein
VSSLRWWRRPRAAIIAVGWVVGKQIDEEYVDMLIRVNGDSGAIELVIIGNKDDVRTDLRAKLQRSDVWITENGRVPSVGASVTAFRHRRAVVCNPRHSGNGGSLLQAAVAGVPVALFSDNDAECTLPPACFGGSASEVQNRIKTLLESRSARRRAVKEVHRYRAEYREESFKIVSALISPDTPHHMVDASATARLADD